MTGRPEQLFPLFSKLETLPGIGPKTAGSLSQIDIIVPKDLVFALPTAVNDRRLQGPVDDLPSGKIVTLRVRIERHTPPRTKNRPYRIDVIADESVLQIVYFHARPAWLQSQYPIGEERIVSGKLDRFDHVPQMLHPDYVVTPDRASEIPDFEAIYPLTQGVSLKVMSKAVQAAVSLCPDLQEWADAELISQEGWPAWQIAVRRAHDPQATSDLLSSAPARQRLAYDELFAHQLTLALARGQSRRLKGQVSRATGALQSKVLSTLPFKPTNAQMRAIQDIQDDMSSRVRMNRLLQGDVGSGKTLVALMSLLAAVEAGGQGGFMAPTEILARQHYLDLKPLCDEAGVVMELLTGRDTGKERRAKLSALANGDISLLVGTHALFQSDVVFKDLRLAVVDEQHRFGVAQRLELGRKSKAADVLVMTATPIPRSLSLAQYGDMDVSILNEKPPGRTPIKTALGSVERLKEVVDRLRSSIEKGSQAYWVCPLVDESEVSDLTSAEQRFQFLRAELGEGNVGLVHGQMPNEQKDAAMRAFVSGEIKCLVATTVIEVGVNVPNASIMVIERAENFGLAQLHQLRGRVGRGAESSTCLLLFQAPLSENARRRLEILRETNDGFRIAEEDLAMRGAGDVLGTAQSGLPRFRIANLETQSSLMEIAQKDARRLIEADPKLESSRGEAARSLLWLLEQDKAIQMISVG